MAHCVSHFPDEQTSYDIALSLARAGAAYIEIQFPFSDPFADGPLIQGACALALGRGGFTVSKGFALVKRLSLDIAARGLQSDVFIMAYGNTAAVYGMDAFVRAARRAGAKGIIIPDIPFDSDAGAALRAACRVYGVAYVPVTVVTGGTARLRELLRAEKPDYIYVSLRAGITGGSTAITPAVKAFLEDRALANVRVLGGFGIREARQVRLLAAHAHAAVAGSVFVDAIVSAMSAKRSPAAEVGRVCRGLLQ